MIPKPSSLLRDIRRPATLVEGVFVHVLLFLRQCFSANAIYCKDGELPDIALEVYPDELDIPAPLYVAVHVYLTSGA